MNGHDGNADNFVEIVGQFIFALVARCATYVAHKTGLFVVVKKIRLGWASTNVNALVTVCLTVKVEFGNEHRFAIFQDIHATLTSHGDKKQCFHSFRFKQSSFFSPRLIRISKIRFFFFFFLPSFFSLGRKLFFF